MPILPTDRDPRLITVRRGGSLSDDHHRMLAEWAVACADHVLPLFEREAPDDARPRDALEVARGWIRGEVPMREAHRTAFVANAAGKGRPDPARFAALAAGQAVAVAHVPAHDLGAAAYAVRAASAAAPGPEREVVRLAERDWQREQVPAELLDLVLDDQRARSAICWDVFDD
ncbi:putative immunity protein [Isoptericola sp. NPDC056573]|uniref:putative immunity protein n=1 Tax=Isoptericola sp. NPDC056573 TaxID=3345868 RepID=UPI0036B91F38